jgi:hypothetical protein
MRLAGWHVGQLLNDNAGSKKGSAFLRNFNLQIPTPPYKKEYLAVNVVQHS